MRRKFLGQMSAVAAGLAVPHVFAQPGGYPDKPIKMIVGFAPGGTVDPIMRIIQPKIAEMFGQPIVIDNRPGASTAIAAGFVAKQAPDGYNMLFTAANTHLIHTIDAPQIPYDPLKDFTPVATVSRSGWAMVVHESVPANTVPEFIAYCKANPNKVSYATSGAGNANHLAFERFNMATGIKTVHVPYKAANTAAVDLMAGRIQAYFTGLGVLQPVIQSGKVKALAYTGGQQGTVPPNMTFAAAGLPELDEIDTINIIMGPANLPAPIIARWASAAEKALAMPDVKTSMVNAGQYAYYMSPEQLGARMRRDIGAFKKIVKDANIKMTEG